MKLEFYKNTYNNLRKKKQNTHNQKVSKID